MLGRLDGDMQKNETGPLSYTIYKNKFKWIRDLNVRQETIKILEKNTSSNLFDLGHSNFLLDTSLKARKTKSKHELLGHDQNKKLLHNEGNNQQN